MLESASYSICMSNILLGTALKGKVVVICKKKGVVT